MPSVIPYEGRNFVGRYLYQRDLIDRDATLLLGLFTNPVADLSLSLSTVVEPTGVGYERIPLNDLDWDVDGAGRCTHPVQTFVAGSGGWSGTVQGFFICTFGAGGTGRLLQYEFDSQQLLVAPLERLGQTVTVITPNPHQLSDGNLVNISGANQPEYNGVFPVVVTGPNSFTYTVTGSPATPATGVILTNRAFQMDVGAIYRVTPALIVGD